jgi:hypothetical protein
MKTTMTPVKTIGAVLGMLLVLSVWGLFRERALAVQTFEQYRSALRNHDAAKAESYATSSVSPVSAGSVVAATRWINGPNCTPLREVRASFGVWRITIFPCANEDNLGIEMRKESGKWVVGGTVQMADDL